MADPLTATGSAPFQSKTEAAEALGKAFTRAVQNFHSRYGRDPEFTELKIRANCIVRKAVVEIWEPR